MLKQLILQNLDAGKLSERKKTLFLPLFILDIKVVRAQAENAANNQQQQNQAPETPTPRISSQPPHDVKTRHFPVLRTRFDFIAPTTADERFCSNNSHSSSWAAATVPAKSQSKSISYTTTSKGRTSRVFRCLETFYSSKCSFSLFIAFVNCHFR